VHHVERALHGARLPAPVGDRDLAPLTPHEVLAQALVLERHLARLLARLQRRRLDLDVEVGAEPEPAALPGLEAVERRLPAKPPSA
jgi:hypothetical protein